MAYKEYKIKTVYFPIGHVAAKARVSTEYIRNISNKLGFARTRGENRKYTQKEIDYISEIIRTAKNFTKTELAIMIVNRKL